MEYNLAKWETAYQLAKILLFLVENRGQTGTPASDLRHIHLVSEINQTTTVVVEALEIVVAISGTFCRQTLQTDGASIMSGRTKGLRGRLILYFSQGQSDVIRVSAVSWFFCFKYHRKERNLNLPINYIIRINQIILNYLIKWILLIN